MPVEMVVAPEFPCVTESAAGEAAKLKSGVVLELQNDIQHRCNRAPRRTSAWPPRPLHFR